MEAVHRSAVRRSSRSLASVLSLALASGTALRAATVAEAVSFSASGRRASRPGALEVAGREVRLPVARLPARARVVRAVLRLDRERLGLRGGDDDAREPVRIIASVSGDPAGSTALPLRPPRFLDLDASRPVRDALAAGDVGRSDDSIVFRVESFPGWIPERTRLDVTLERPEREAPAEDRAGEPSGVEGLRAWHVEGHTFLVWSQPERGPEGELPTVGELRHARSRTEREAEVRYRIYRSDRPLASHGLRDADLVDEVDPFTAWNEEFAGMDAPPDSAARRYSVRDGEAPVPPGTGIYVHAAGERRTSWYAVSRAVDGAEDMGKAATAGPIAEGPGPGRPVLQRTVTPDEFLYVRRPTLHYFVRWESPPTSNVPSRPFDYLVAVPEEPRDPAPLCIALHCWGGSLEGGYGWWYGARDGAMMLATNQIPYDWWASYHECLGTARPFSEGTNRGFTQNRTWSFVEWMRGRWKLDPARAFVGGSSMGGSGVSHWIRQGDRLAYGISWVGVHIPSASPQFRGSYEGAVGKVEWGLPHESGRPVFEHLDGARFLREHPTVETAFLAYSNGKNDSAIGWRQAFDFTRALQDTRRPHIFVWGQGGHGQRAYFPTPTGGGDNVEGGLDIRSDRSLPAFTRCSLDDDLGDGDPSRGDPEGQLNLYTRWVPDGTVEGPDRWAATIYLIDESPFPEATTDVTPRRCQEFRAAAGSAVSWRVSSPDGSREIASGRSVADAHGIATAERVPIARERRRLELQVER